MTIRNRPDTKRDDFRRRRLSLQASWGLSSCSTPPITAAATLAVIEEGLLALEEPVECAT
jgi:hypothetical protein